MTRDIGGFMSWFLGQLVSLVGFCFDTLDSIGFLGVSLLDYSIAIFLLSVVLPIIFSLVRSRSSTGKREKYSKGKGSKE